MASVGIFAGRFGSAIALDMKQTDISAWLSPLWLGVLKPGDKGHMV